MIEPEIFLISSAFKQHDGSVRFVPHFATENILEAVDLAEKTSLDLGVAIIHCGDSAIRKIYKNGLEVIN